MASVKTIVYECEVCGTEVTVNSEGMPNLSPIYCCGISLEEKELKPARKTQAKKTAAKTSVKKATAGKPVKKVAAKPARKAAAKRSKKK